jgi:hypothetical protein
MPFPYADIPNLKTWQSDSSAYFAARSSDRVLQTIDELVAACNDATLVAAHPEFLFYLRGALRFWSNKVNKVPANKPPDNANPTNALPTKAVFSGSEQRTRAIAELLSVVSRKLAEHHGLGSTTALEDTLFNTYGRPNHEQGNDDVFIQRYRDQEGVYVYLEEDGLRRKYKLRFRDGLAWRWYERNQNYARFDTTDNTESETNDRMTHFVMDRRGRIYAGFDKDVVWFKHSSLIGGQGTLAAGRMRADNGRISFVENDSGHYQPAHQQMRNLLERLQLYGANTTNTQIRRLSDKTVFQASAVKASSGAWPDGRTGH